MRWRVGLIDSCGAAPNVVAGARFIDRNGSVQRVATTADATGHGTRIAELLTRDRGQAELLLAQVFADSGIASAAAVAAAIDWCVTEGSHLLHLSLGLSANRPVLADAVARAQQQGCLVIASTPARGGPVYPAAYPGVIRGTGDARCAPGEISQLAPDTFGGCAWFDSADGRGQGASIGAAAITHLLIGEPAPLPPARAVAVLAARARYQGPERRRNVI
jgi:hypothetical protein